MAIRKGLGRGLDALLGEYTEEAQSAATQEADIRLLDINRDQPRKTFDEEKLNELAASIARHGLVQPILVKKRGDRYLIIAGERRYRAARKAGLAKVPVVVRDLEDAEVMEFSLIENIQRENLNPIEEAAAIRFLMQQHDLTQEEVSSRLGKSRPAIANALRLLSLPAPVQKLLCEGVIQPGHAKALLSLKDEAALTRMAGLAAEEGWSVRETEERVKAALTEAPAKEKPRKEKPRLLPELADAEIRMRERLGTKVTVQGSAKRGKIVIEYFSADDLQAIYDAIVKD